MHTIHTPSASFSADKMTAGHVLSPVHNGSHYLWDRCQSVLEYFYLGLPQYLMILPRFCQFDPLLIVFKLT